MSQPQRWNRQVDHHGVLTIKGVLGQIERRQVGILGVSQVCSVMQADVAGSQHHPPVGQCVLVDVYRLQSIRITLAPVLRNPEFLAVVPFGRLQMLRPQEQPLAPMYCVIRHDVNCWPRQGPPCVVV